MAVFSADLDLPVVTIVARWVQRWDVEVTFEETRRHLGVETQRQCSDLATTRITSALFAMTHSIVFQQGIVDKNRLLVAEIAQQMTFPSGEIEGRYRNTGRAYHRY